MSAIDITPTPRILRTLGEIPFDIWQCIAELVDNSLDAFDNLESAGSPLEGARVEVSWSQDAPANSSEITIVDNGPGMAIETLQSAARAGYTSNDPISNLGLFGMGFNIATARLGGETHFLSTLEGADEWVGICINFDDLIKKGEFSAPVITEQKEDKNVSGTKITIKDLREGVLADLKNKKSTIRRRLEVVYSPILEKQKVSILIQGSHLKPHPHCVWGESRFIVRKGLRVHAVQHIDRDLGTAYFDVNRNRYISEHEITIVDSEMQRTGMLREGIVERSRRLRGWIGIQRYSDPNDFGIDFIRNGRKILIADKSVFSFENPATGTLNQEYPVELGSTVGGRIVGEIHVDYLIPTYQKNGFDRSNPAWNLTVEAIRGSGPILQKNRRIFEYDGDNISPLGLLISAYRRTDAGTKCLAVNRDVAKKYTEEFRRGNPEYLSDEKWFKAAQEVDLIKSEGESPRTPPEPPPSRSWR